MSDTSDVGAPTDLVGEIVHSGSKISIAHFESAEDGSADDAPDSVLCASGLVRMLTRPSFLAGVRSRNPTIIDFVVHHIGELVDVAVGRGSGSRVARRALMDTMPAISRDAGLICALKAFIHGADATADRNRVEWALRCLVVHISATSGVVLKHLDGAFFARCLVLGESLGAARELLHFLATRGNRATCHWLSRVGAARISWEALAGNSASAWLAGIFAAVVASTDARGCDWLGDEQFSCLLTWAVASPAVANSAIAALREVCASCTDADELEGNSVGARALRFCCSQLRGLAELAGSPAAGTIHGSRAALDVIAGACAGLGGAPHELVEAAGAAFDLATKRPQCVPLWTAALGLIRVVAGAGLVGQVLGGGLAGRVADLLQRSEPEWRLAGGFLAELAGLLGEEEEWPEVVADMLDARDAERARGYGGAIPTRVLTSGSTPIVD